MATGARRRPRHNNRAGDAGLGFGGSEGLMIWSALVTRRYRRRIAVPSFVVLVAFAAIGIIALRIEPHGKIEQFQDFRRDGLVWVARSGRAFARHQ